MNPLEQGSALLERVKRENLSVPVLYRAVSGWTLTVRAVPGKTLFRAENEYGVTVRTESRDFIVSAADLTAEPAQGDVIESMGVRYEVLAPNNEPVWRWSGPLNRSRRIHTKEIGSV